MSPEEKRASNNTYHKKWYKANKDKHAFYTERWRKNNPDKIREYNRRYREKVAAAKLSEEQNKNGTSEP